MPQSIVREVMVRTCAFVAIQQNIESTAAFSILNYLEIKMTMLSSYARYCIGIDEQPVNIVWDAYIQLCVCALSSYMLISSS